MNNLTNITSPTGITSHTKSLIDIIIINYTNDEMFTEVLDLGYSDHLAQFLDIKLKNVLKDPITTCKIHFTDNNVEEHKYLLHEETWAEVLASNEPNTSFNLFMNSFTYDFNTAFPLKVTYVKGKSIAGEARGLELENKGSENSSLP